jgi:glycosyltransferase involved in cell wall biosynthesis
VTGRPDGRGLTVSYVLGTTSGGTGPHVAMLAEGAAGRGAAVTVFGPASTRRFFHDHGEFPAAPGQVPARSWEFVPVEIADRPRPVRDAAALLRLRRLLTGAAPDVVHAHGLRAGALTALALAGAPGRRSALLVTVHNAPPSAGLTGGVYAVLERIIARRADAVASVSGDLAARMRRLGARDAGRALVPAPAASAPPAGAVAKVRHDLGGAGRPVVFAAGRLTAQKGFGTLLAAAARWQRRDPVPLLVIAGDGPLAGPLHGQARSAGLAVRFLGQRGDVPALLACADVVVLASSWEGQPLIVQETLRAGRPLVATRVGGVPDLTGEDAALLVAPGDAGALAAAVLSVLDDPERSARLSAAALGRAAALPDEAAAVDAALALYRRIAARRRPVPRGGRPTGGRPAGNAAGPG